MGLIRALKGAVGGVMADQWKEYFYCDALPEYILAARGYKRTGRRSSNTKGSDDIITNGSVIAVNEGQCMLITDQGRVVDVCAEPGAYIYDISTEPSLFYGDLSQSIENVCQTIGARFSFGGDAGKNQRVYYFNIKELMGNKYGTPNPVPFRVVDQNIGLDMDISVRCFGEYSYRITNPVLFYANVCGNVSDVFTREQIDRQLKSELVTALQPAFARISEMGIRYSALPGHTAALADALNTVLSPKWRQLRGIELVSVGVSSVKASEEDEAMIKELQRNAVFRNPNMAAAHLVGAQASAMQSAASNRNAGPAMAFMGMNMAGSAGGASVQDLFAMGQQNNPLSGSQQQHPSSGSMRQNQHDGSGQQQNPASGAEQTSGRMAGTWQCACGAVNTGKFCCQCGTKAPELRTAQADAWICPSCGSSNKGRFCTECGQKKPQGVPQYRCDKCGWKPADPAHPPKFCPECGDPFGDGDMV